MTDPGGRCHTTHVLVMAKSPVAGRVKTRLCPPCTPAEAAAIAEAALADTLDVVAACGAGRRIVALDGAPGPWLPPGFEVVPQVEGGLDRRLAAAWSAAGGAGVQIGMDTPQVTAALLDGALASLDDTSAALGLAVDGGWWAIGLRRPDPRVFIGIPMSTDATGAAQHARLGALGLSVTMLPALVDLDTAADLPAVTASGSAIRTTAQARRIGMLPVAPAV
jgi:rSAM/selenodomain-associated transferase 1